MRKAIDSLVELRKIFFNSLRVDIILLLFIHGELNLTKISELTERSKSAISRQMMRLTELDMISSYEIDENKPGIPRKYFKITDSFKSQFSYFDPEDFKKMNESEKKASIVKFRNYLISSNAILAKLVNKTDDYIDELTDINPLDLSYPLPVDIGHIFLPESFIPEFKELTMKYISDIVKLKCSYSGEKKYIASILLHLLE